MLAGLAGAGKTATLHALAAAGEQVLDLESLARHRGSAFGGLGMERQPSHRTFVHTVRTALAAADPVRPLWVEDEGPFIGRVGLPPELVRRLAEAPVIELRPPLAERIARLVEEYGSTPPEALIAAVGRSAARLGPAVSAAACAAIRSGDLPGAVGVLLPAYDAAYAHRAARLHRRILAVLP